MVSAKRRAREKENLRRAILDAARELFVTEDFKAVSMRRIAEKIEYSPTAIYLYFKDKEEILFHLVEEGFSLLSARMEELNISDPIERLRQVGHIYIDFALTQPHYYQIMFQLGDQMFCAEYEDQKIMGHRTFEYIYKCVAEAVEQGRFQPVAHVAVMAHAIWAMVHGAVSLDLAGRLKMLPAEAHDAFYQTIVEASLRGFYPETR